MARDYVRGRQSGRARREEKRNSLSPWILAGVLIGVLIAGLAYFKMQHAHMFSEQMAEANKLVEQKVQKSPPPPTKSPQPRFDFYTVLPKDDKPVPTNQPATTQPQANPAALLPDDMSNADEEQTLPQQQAKTAPKLKETQATAHEPPVTTVDLPEENTATPKEKPVDATAPNRNQVLADVKQALEAEIGQTAPQPQSKAVDKSAYVLVLGTFRDYAAADEKRAQLALQGVEANIKKIQKNTEEMYRLWLGPYTSLRTAQKQQHHLQNNQVQSALVKDN